MSQARNEKRTIYRTQLTTLEGGRTGILLYADQKSLIVDGAGRRQYQREAKQDSQVGRVELAKLTMAQAAGLLEALVSDVAFMADDHPDCRETR